MWPRGSGSWDRLALALAALAPFAVSAVLVPFRDDFDNTQIALVLVVVVVAVAAYGNRTAGYLAALSAGLWFDFFFTRPTNGSPSPTARTSRPSFCCSSSGSP
jgi:K+-sensing histidine kinase KdpD